MMRKALLLAALSVPLHHGVARAEGMPQFNPDTMANQVTWLVLVFGAMFLVMWKLVLPRLGSVIEERADRIADDLARAEELKDEADKARIAYEAVMAEADAKARALVGQAVEEMRGKDAAERADLARRTDEKVRGAEQRIAAARGAARDEIRAVAIDIASAVAAKVGGEKADAGMLAKAVDARIAAAGGAV